MNTTPCDSVAVETEGDGMQRYGILTEEALDRLDAMIKGEGSPDAEWLLECVPLLAGEVRLLRSEIVRLNELMATQRVIVR